MSNSLHPWWLDVLLNRATYGHPCSDIQIVETHISWVVLTGDWAYKLKKPVNFGFVDFTTLELRRVACMDELRLNLRTAPDLYDSVVPLTNQPTGPRFGGEGTILEYAVRMRQFERNDTFDRLQQQGKLSAQIIETLARRVADLHQAAAIALADSSFGSPETVLQQAQDCVDEITRLDLVADLRSQLDQIRRWIHEEWSRLKELFVERKRDGHVRECHGDLHLGNVVLYAGCPTLFDCLEFNPQLRWIDIVSDIAFVVMDLHDRGAPQLAWHALNEWLQQTGDYEGLPLLKYYLAYRSLIRSKVAALRSQQPGLSVSDSELQQDRLESYLKLTSALIQPNRPALLLMHGLSGSGKSFVARHLAASIGAVQIRSDVERKRLFGLWPARDFSSDGVAEVYSPAATEQTYRRLRTLANTVVSAGYFVIVDAAFLSQSQRAEFVSMADALGFPWAMIECQAPDSVLRDRITRRQLAGGDPSDADSKILDMQLASVEPISEVESRRRIIVNTTSGDLRAAVESVDQFLSRGRVPSTNAMIPATTDN
jgi:aminoglycoside phosphotransferase family enzyme/predicted kinase